MPVIEFNSVDITEYVNKVDFDGCADVEFGQTWELATADLKPWNDTFGFTVEFEWFLVPTVEIYSVTSQQLLLDPFPSPPQWGMWSIN